MAPADFSVPIGDGGNPSPLGEARFGVTWSRAALPDGRAHEERPEVHLVWIPKYRKAVLTGEVALRVRDLLRQIAAEHELEIVSGKVARDHVHLAALLSNQPGREPDRAVAERNQLAGPTAGISAPTKEVLGKASMGARISGGQFRNDHR